MQKSHKNLETLDMIHFHTFRHWKGTTQYTRTKDLLYVQKLLGHRSIKTKLRYIQLVDVPLEERFISKVAMKVEEEIELIELGFEYVTGEYDDGGKIFRKTKISYLESGSSMDCNHSSYISFKSTFLKQRLLDTTKLFKTW